MDSRREFLEASAAALTVAATRPLFGAGIQGANDRVRMAIIGTGNRGGRVFDSFCRQKDCQFTAAAEVNKARLDSWMTPARQTFKLDVVGDYRKILDRKDIDAVLIATPDHWHSQQMVDAISAGKDVYVEKPASNSIPRINAMLDAYKKGKQVVQVGTHQRSWDHFLEAKRRARQRCARQRDPGDHHAARLVRPPEGSRSAGAGRPRLGDVAGAGAEEAVQADPPRVPGLVRLRRRPGRRLGGAPRGRRSLVHERRPQSAAEDDGQRRVPRRARRRSGNGAGLVLDLVALRQLPDDVRQRSGLHG